jgi:hypothetical protein
MVVTKRGLALLGLAAIALYAAPINAAPPPAVFKDDAGNVYVHTGVTAGSRVDVDLVGAPLTRKIRAGYCGQITLGPSTSVPNIGDSVTIGGTVINLASLTVPANVPKCVGNAFDPPAAANFKTADGKYVLKGYTPGASYDVKFDDVPASANATVNGCSFATIRHTTKRPLPAQIKINGTAHTVASLPTANPPICRRNSETGVSTRYVPASW